MSLEKSSRPHDGALWTKEALRDDFQRLGVLFDAGEFGVHIPHEMIEVAAHSVTAHGVLQRCEEQVHEERFAAANPAPQVNAADRPLRRFAGKPPQERTEPLEDRGRMCTQILTQNIQAQGGGLLPAVELEAMGAHLGAQARSDCMRTAQRIGPAQRAFVGATSFGSSARSRLPASSR